MYGNASVSEKTPVHHNFRTKFELNSRAFIYFKVSISEKIGLV